MTKKQNNNKSKNASKRAPRRRRMVLGAPATDHVAAYAQLLRDPCNANTALAAYYPGEKGFVQRFISDISINTTAGHTSGLILFHPNSNGLFTVTAASSASASPINLGSYILGLSPGQGFLSGAASKTRALAACTQCFPSAVSVTNMTGEYAMGIISMSNTFGTVSVDNFFNILSNRGNMTKEKAECKWFPGAMDDRYVPWNTNTNIDTSDTNVIAVAYRGYPAGAALSVRLTNVIEWTPNTSVGLSATNQVSAGVNHNNVVAAMQRQNPHWYHNLSHEASNLIGGLAHDAGKVVRYGARRALSYGVASLERSLGSAMGGALLAL